MPFVSILFKTSLDAETVVRAFEMSYLRNTTVEEKKMKPTGVEDDDDDDDESPSTGTNEVLIFKMYLQKFFHEIS